MPNVTCEIIKDLMPLYVDGVLSEDGKELVEKHLETCPECTEYRKRLSDCDITAKQEKAADQKIAIKKIRRRIYVKKMAAACVAALLVAVVGLGLFYKMMVEETYLPYEDSGVFVENNVLKTKNNYYCQYIFDSPDGKTQFMFLTTTEYESWHAKKKEMGAIEIRELVGDEAEWTEVDENGGITEKGPLTSLYYVSKENAKKMKEDGFWAKGDHAEKVKEIIAESTLVWKAE